jgi:L-aminopeptidase/D-esterase-like protein
VGLFTVGTLVAVNSVGSCADPATGNLWARGLASGDELGPMVNKPLAELALTKIDLIKPAAAAGANTTIAIVATDATLTKAEVLRLAIMAQDGLALAIRPAHTPFDGDTVFGAATCRRALPANRALALSELGAAAATTLARAIGRALWQASSIGNLKCYRETIGA